ncbi:integrase core domain-containing protein [Geodermatophilus sp. SYSU D00703]
MPQLVVTAVLVEGRSKSQVARDYGFSRRWVITLVQRYLAEGDAGLQPRPRRPLRSPTRIADEVEDEIVAIRKDLHRHGYEAGAATIAAHLTHRHRSSPAVSTIWRIPTARGFVTPEPHKRPESSYVRFEAAQPNERWPTDISHWPLADGTDAEICNWLDDHSRYCRAAPPPGCSPPPRSTPATGPSPPSTAIRPVCPATTARCSPAATAAADEWRRRSPCTLAASCSATRGKVERFHQTLENWLARQPSVTTLTERQQQLDAFRDYYNTVRPHRALSRRTPAEAYADRPKVTATGIPLIAGHLRVRHDKIGTNGKLTLRHNSRLHHIGLGRRHAGTPVLVLVHDLHVRVLSTSGRLARDLTLAPTRDNQPQTRT